MASIVPIRLRCNLLIDPLAIADVRPVLSWVLEHSEKGVKNARQSAYRITVSSEPGGKSDLWDSGKVSSSETTGVRYEGLRLVPFQTAYWNVVVWDGNGDRSEPGYESRWTQAPGEWPAAWIGYDKHRSTEDTVNFKGAQWIWHEDDPPLRTTPGFCSFKKTINLSEESLVEVLVTADDRFVLSVDGKEWARNEDMVDSWTVPIHTKRVLSAGEYELDFEVENLNHGAGALLAKIRANGVDLATTDKTWAAKKPDEIEWKRSLVLAEYGGAPWGELRDLEEFLPPASELQHVFKTEGVVAKATLYATALGMHDFRVNGFTAQDDFFAPGWTDYNLRLHYRAYDVTDLMQEGENSISATLTDGWYSGNVGFGPRRNHYGVKTWLSAFVRLEDADGNVTTVATDENWRARIGKTKQSDFLMGETRGAAEEDWHAVDISEQGLNLEPYPMEPCRPYEWIHAQSIEWVDGKMIYDLGQNFAGVCRVMIDHLDDGAEVVIRHGEVLNPDGSLYTANLRAARAIDTVVGDGGPVDWIPKGTFHGFRYVEVDGLEGEPSDVVTGLALSNISEDASTFVCSDPRLNQLWSNIDWTQRSNFIEIPTDCPQRDERLGWTGDIQMYARTAAIRCDAQSFLRKWLVDLEDSQREDGQYPMVAPLKVAGNDGGPAWSDAGTIVPWALYEVYGDREVLERQWDSMVRFIGFCESRSPDGKAPEEFHCFGDWLNVDSPTSNNIIFTAYFAHSVDLMARVAKVLGKDASKFEDLFAKAKSTFVREFVSEEGVVEGDTQTGYVLALAFDLLDKPFRSLAEKKLVENLDRVGHLTTGFVGTRDLMLTLREIGRTDLAYKLLLSDDYPGWLFSIKHGATTIWERWNGWTPEDGFADPGMNSFSHYTYGAVGQFMMETIGGIRPMEPGYTKFLIAPEPGPLTSASSSYESVRGLISSDWRIVDDRFVLTVSVPPNSEAVVRLPNGEENTVGSGEWSF